MQKIGKIQALKEFFSTLDKPLTSTELVKLRREDKDGFDELASEAAKALGMEITELSK